MSKAIHRICWLVITVFVTSVNAALRAQANVSQDPGNLHTAQNSVFLELGGNGLGFSMNYERLVFNSQAVRLGIGYGDGVAFPALYNIILGAGNHKLEIGLGATFMVSVKTGGQNRLYATGNFGYRWLFSTETGQNFLRISFTPLVGDYASQTSAIVFIPWGGVSLGMMF